MGKMALVANLLRLIILKAAQYRYHLAQYQLGYCYEKGIGVKVGDIEKSKYWNGKQRCKGMNRR